MPTQEPLLSKKNQHTNFFQIPFSRFNGSDVTINLLAIVVSIVYINELSLFHLYFWKFGLSSRSQKQTSKSFLMTWMFYGIQKIPRRVSKFNILLAKLQSNGL